MMPVARKVFYLCNREKCGGRCSYPQCKHTQDVNFAKHNIYERKKFRMILGAMWEVDESENEE